MTNKTIALDHAVAERLVSAVDNGALFRPDDLEALRAALAEPHTGPTLVSYAEDMSTCTLTTGDGIGYFYDRVCAEPVPLAGGEPETVATVYVALRDDFNSFVCLGRPGNGGPLYKEEPLIRLSGHRAHVTRLQAEVDRWGGLWSKAISAGARLEEERSSLQAELTKARELLVSTSARLQMAHRNIDRLIELDPKHKVKLLTDALHTIVYAYKCIENPAPNQSAPADNHETHCVLLDPEEPAAECTCKHRFMSLADDPRRCADCDAVEVQEGPADKDEECAHDFRMFSGECHKCGADWIPGKNYAPSLIETLRANGDRIAMEATIAQQAQRIADLEAGKGQGEPVAWADPLAFSNFKAHAHLGGPYDHECMWAKPAHAGMVPLYLHAEQPAPVAVVMPERAFEDYLDSVGTYFGKGWNACLDEVARLNPGIKS